MKTITIYGPGCPRCDLAEKIVRQVVADCGSDARVEKITDFAELAKAGIVITPTITVDGQTVLTGRIPKEEEVEDWLCE